MTTSPLFTGTTSPLFTGTSSGVVIHVEIDGKPRDITVTNAMLRQMLERPYKVGDRVTSTDFRSDFFRRQDGIVTRVHKGCLTVQFGANPVDWESTGEQWFARR